VRFVSPFSIDCLQNPVLAPWHTIGTNWNAALLRFCFQPPAPHALDEQWRLGRFLPAMMVKGTFLDAAKTLDKIAAADTFI